MRKRFSRSLVILTAVILCLSSVGEMFPALADGFATYGNAVTDTTFYVSASGPAVLTLSQTGMGRIEKQYIYNTANVTSEQVYAQYTVLYKGTMDAYWHQGAYWNQQTCVLNFTRADVYTVRVLPVAVQNMQSTSSLWCYTRWISVPSWYASGVQNCTISPDMPYLIPTQTPRPTATPTKAPVKGSVTVLYRDVNGNYLASDVYSLAAGTHTIKPGRTFTNYTLVGATSYKVTISSAGVASEQVLTFYYQQNAPTPQPKFAYMVFYQDTDGRLLGQETLYLTPGTHTIKPSRTFTNYVLVGATSYKVTISSAGVASDQQVTFYYQQNAPTPKPKFAYTLFYQDTNGRLLGQDTLYLTVGTHTVKPKKSFNNYTLISAGSVRIQIRSNGTGNPDSVTFLYQYQAPTPKPTKRPTAKPTARPTSKPPKGNVISPVGYTSLFRPGYSTHQDKEQNLYKLFDNDRSTVFNWTYWTSEAWSEMPGKDEEANFTIYFGGGATVGAIGFRNGNCTGSAAYSNNARAYRWRVRVWTDDGKYHDTVVSLNDSYSADYKVYPLKSIYHNVDKVQLYLIKGRVKAGKKDKNNLCISDLIFYTAP